MPTETVREDYDSGGLRRGIPVKKIDPFKITVDHGATLILCCGGCPGNGAPNVSCLALEVPRLKKINTELLEALMERADAYVGEEGWEKVHDAIAKANVTR